VKQNISNNLGNKHDLEMLGSQLNEFQTEACNSPALIYRASQGRPYFSDIRVVGTYHNKEPSQ
jgi:hypothetical protein